MAQPTGGEMPAARASAGTDAFFGALALVGLALIVGPIVNGHVATTLGGAALGVAGFWAIFWAAFANRRTTRRRRQPWMAGVASIGATVGIVGGDILGGAFILGVLGGLVLSVGATQLVYLHRG